MRKIAPVLLTICRQSTGQPLVRGSLIALMLSGCSASLPEIQTGSLPAGAAVSTLPEAETVTGNPAELYARIARGAHSCWLGPERALHDTHQFHAQANPASKGGNATIVIYQRGAKANKKQRLAAMRILITRLSTSQSKVAVINRRFAADTARQMREEVIGWANRKATCLGANPASSAAQQKILPAKQ